MKKIPIQITDENVKFINDNNLSFSKVVNHLIDKMKDDVLKLNYDALRSYPVRKSTSEHSKELLCQEN